MSNVFFDSADYYVSADITKKWTSVSGTAEIDPLGGRRASGGLKLSAGALVAKTFSNIATITAGFSYKPSGYEGDVLRISDGSDVQIKITSSNDGKLNIVRGDSVVLGTSLVCVDFDGSDYMYIEVKAYLHGSTGYVKIRATQPGDGSVGDSSVEVFSITNTRTRWDNVAGEAVCNKLQICGTSGGFAYFDDVYINDASGTTNASYLGDSLTVALLPTLDGQYQEMSTSESGAHFQMVRAAAPQTAKYLTGSADGQRACFRFASLIPIQGPIAAVAVRVYCESNPDSGGEALQILARAGGTDTYSADISVPSSPGYIEKVYQTNPNIGGSVGWTENTIEATEFGVKVTNNSVRIYQIVVEVLRFHGVTGAYGDTRLRADGTLATEVWGCEEFVEERFNVAIRYGMRGGPVFDTTVATSIAGYEQRNSNRLDPLREWELASGELYNQAEKDALISFFRERMGQLGGFRIKDWTDFRCTKEQGVVTAIPGLGVSQLQKKYTNGDNVVYRDILKPVNGTIQFYRDGDPISSENLYDTRSGSTSLGGDDLTWSGEFDVPARFAVDKFDVEFVAYRNSDGEALYAVSGLSAKELRRDDLGGGALYPSLGSGGGGGALNWDGNSGRGAPGGINSVVWLIDTFSTETEATYRITEFERFGGGTGRAYAAAFPTIGFSYCTGHIIHGGYWWYVYGYDTNAVDDYTVTITRVNLETGAFENVYSENISEGDGGTIPALATATPLGVLFIFGAQSETRHVLFAEDGTIVYDVGVSGDPVGAYGPTFCNDGTYAYYHYSNVSYPTVRGRRVVTIADGSSVTETIDEGEVGAKAACAGNIIYAVEFTHGSSISMNPARAIRRQGNTGGIESLADMGVDVWAVNGAASMTRNGTVVLVNDKKVVVIDNAASVDSFAVRQTTPDALWGISYPAGGLGERTGFSSGCSILPLSPNEVLFMGFNTGSVSTLCWYDTVTGATSTMVVSGGDYRPYGYLLETGTLTEDDLEAWEYVGRVSQDPLVR